MKFTFKTTTNAVQVWLGERLLQTFRIPRAGALAETIVAAKTFAAWFEETEREEAKH